MIKTRKLNADGIAALLKWFENEASPKPPVHLLDGDAFTDPLGEYDIDPSRRFASRFEFGVYLNEVFAGADFGILISTGSDGLWAWLALIYFDQLSEKGVRRLEHYIVMRKGSAGSLAYRQAVRTSFELVHIHGACAQICLSSPMHTFGDMTEQLASRQTIAHNRGFFQTAFELYMRNGRLRKGASSRPKNPKIRQRGDRTGLGSARRLAIALQRLDLTYDTEEMNSTLLKAVLPKEFAKWNSVP